MANSGRVEKSNKLNQNAIIVEKNSRNCKTSCYICEWADLQRHLAKKNGKRKNP
ncbi:MAG: hypothetical protein JWR76_568, partial [Mucilaginibacter sp.]|nr:hypothetical protein [Mucilaginibacter sp.]